MLFQCWVQPETIKQNWCYVNKYHGKPLCKNIEASKTLYILFERISVYNIYFSQFHYTHTTTLQIQLLLLFRVFYTVLVYQSKIVNNYFYLRTEDTLLKTNTKSVSFIQTSSLYTKTHCYTLYFEFIFSLKIIFQQWKPNHHLLDLFYVCS